MPLILITGHPSSGKTTIVERLRDKFIEAGRDVCVVRDDEYGSFNRSCYTGYTQEKDLRSYIRSKVQHNLTPTRILICDGLNYVKGFRYELFLGAKMVKTTYCLIQITPEEETCKWLNSQRPEKDRYRDEEITQLIKQFERPDAKFKWENPLFEIKVGKSEKDPLNIGEEGMDDMSVDLEHPSPQFANILFDEIRDCVLEGVPLTANKSTVVVPLAPTNALHVMDRSVQDIIDWFLLTQRTAMRGQQLIVPGAASGSNQIIYLKPKTMSQMNQLKHQFLKATSGNPTINKVEIKNMFVDFLNNNLYIKTQCF